MNSEVVCQIVVGCSPEENDRHTNLRPLDKGSVLDEGKDLPALLFTIGKVDYGDLVGILTVLQALVKREEKKMISILHTIAIFQEKLRDVGSSCSKEEDSLSSRGVGQAVEVEGR